MPDAAPTLPALFTVRLGATVPAIYARYGRCSYRPAILPPGTYHNQGPVTVHVFATGAHVLASREPEKLDLVRIAYDLNPDPSTKHVYFVDPAVLTAKLEGTKPTL